jgi:prepilin-type N-terminal cleavage/methylation domain-containing protein
MRNKDKGFTLIELLVVIIIIGILAAIAIPIFLNQRKKGVDASIKSDVKNMATQVETFYTDSQTYPVAADIVGTTSPSLTVGGEKVTISSGNVLAYAVVTGGFKICGYNLKGTANLATLVFKYDSTNGGLATGAPSTC